jgi:Transcriptional regulator
MINFKTLDLNLLQTLNVLLIEQNVTKAAEKLHLSQPSVSVHLSKLREFFDDPLLLPGSRGMVPTSRALELKEPLQKALDALETAVAPSRIFEPDKAELTLHIAVSDYSETTILIPSILTLRVKAPGIKLAVHQLEPKDIFKKTEQSDIDLAFHIAEEAPMNLHARSLFKDRYVLVGNEHHPALQEPLTTEQFCNLEHIVVSPSGGGFKGVTDIALEQQGLKRNVVLSVPHFLSMKSILQNSNLVAMVPSRLINPNDHLNVIEAPVAVPDFEMLMLWHEKLHRDPAHQWLRQVIYESVQ